MKQSEPNSKTHKRKAERDRSMRAYEKNPRATGTNLRARTRSPRDYNQNPRAAE